MVSEKHTFVKRKKKELLKGVQKKRSLHKKKRQSAIIES